MAVVTSPGAGGRFEPARLIQARRMAMMSRADVAAAVGVPTWQVTGWECSTHVPRPDQVLKLAKALGFLPRFFDAGRPMARLDSMDVFICGKDRRA